MLFQSYRNKLYMDCRMIVRQVYQALADAKVKSASACSSTKKDTLISHFCYMYSDVYTRTIAKHTG